MRRRVHVTEEAAHPPAVSAKPSELSQDADVIDWEVARRNTGNDPAMMEDLIQVFLAECPHMLAEIRRAATTADAVLLHRCAHTLKASAAIFGAQPVLNAALRLEMMGRENKLTLTAQELQRLELQTSRLVNAFQAAREAASLVTTGAGEPHL